MKSIQPLKPLSRTRYGLTVWGSTLFSGTVTIIACSEIFGAGPRISAGEWLILVPCLLAFAALLSSPLLAGFWLALHAVSQTGYRPWQQKTLLCLALLLLYIPFFLILMQIDPLPDSDTPRMLHTCLVLAFVFIGIYRLPTR